MADVLTVVAKLRATKGKGDALAALLKEQVAAVRKAEPGCLLYRPHRQSHAVHIDAGGISRSLAEWGGLAIGLKL